jgi:hypothetical protein
MAEKKQTNIEEALLDMSNIERVLKANSKEILRSVMKEEIEGYVKDSIKEDEDFKEDEIGAGDDEVAAGEENNAGEEVAAGDDEIGGGDDEVATGDDEIEVGNDEIGAGEDEIGGDEEPLDLDMTGASDEDVIAVYKKLKGEDEIEVVSNNEIIIKDPVSGNEYVVKLGGDGDNDQDDLPLPIEPETGEDELEIGNDEIGTGDDEVTTGDDEAGAEDNFELAGAEGEDKTGEEDVEEMVYEIELDDEPEYTAKTGHNTDNGKNLEEKINIGSTNGIGKKQTTIHGPGARLRKESVAKGQVIVPESMVKDYNTLVEESKKLQQENVEFKDALKKFRNMLSETTVFNSNLANVVRLFTEHTTTREEKKQIINRFDETVTSIKESKNLYKTIVSELSSKQSITESVEAKLNKDVTSGKTKITESTVYVDKSTARIKDLINRVEDRNRQ